LIDYSPELNITKENALEYDYPIESFNTIISVAILEHVGFKDWLTLLDK